MIKFITTGSEQKEIFDKKFEIINQIQEYLSGSLHVNEDFRSRFSFEEDEILERTFNKNEYQNFVERFSSRLKERGRDLPKTVVIPLDTIFNHEPEFLEYLISRLPALKNPTLLEWVREEIARTQGLWPDKAIFLIFNNQGISCFCDTVTKYKSIQLGAFEKPEFYTLNKTLDFFSRFYFNGFLKNIEAFEFEGLKMDPLFFKTQKQLFLESGIKTVPEIRESFIHCLEFLNSGFCLTDRVSKINARSKQVLEKAIGNIMVSHYLVLDFDLAEFGQRFFGKTLRLIYTLKGREFVPFAVNLPMIMEVDSIIEVLKLESLKGSYGHQENVNGD